MAVVMASDSESTITIDRVYFETLVRRAKFNTDTYESPVEVQVPASSVSIPVIEHESLKLIAKHYANLRQNLLRGGIDAATIQDDETIQKDNVAAEDSPVYSEPKNPGRGYMSHNLANQPSPLDQLSSRKASMRSGNTGYFHNSAARQPASPESPDTPDWEDTEPTLDDGGSPEPISPFLCEPQTPRPFFEKQCIRTIQLLNLPEGTSHGDITAAVRGGQLLDIFLRSYERSATISFLHAAQARVFYDHTKKNGLYLKNKRVDLKWSDRQFTLSGHVASKLGIGATRNLIIRRCDPNITEDMIRDDLDHIHNLVVIKVKFSGSSCYVSTNSVHNAMFARTCLMSRQKYKGSKIEWDVDECAQPIPTAPMPKPRMEPAPMKKTSGYMANRFQLLNIDDGSDDEEDLVSAFHRAHTRMRILA